MEPFSSSSSSSLIAKPTWELENNIIPMDTPTADHEASSSDAIFYYDEAAQNEFQREKPWANDPHFFKRVRISALALLKMVVHSRSGGTIEVMGLMQSKTDGDAIIVMDAFALPVEGGAVGKCCGMVSFSSWLWMLAFGYRCVYTNVESAISEAISSCCY